MRCRRARRSISSSAIARWGFIFDRVRKLQNQRQFWKHLGFLLHSLKKKEGTFEIFRKRKEVGRVWGNLGQLLNWRKQAGKHE